MKILLFFALASATHTAPLLEDRHGSDPLQSSRPNYYGVDSAGFGSYNHPPEDRAYQRRLYRAAGDDNLKVLLEKLQMIARVANGISLQQELSSGSISSDKLISELLRFGSTTPSQIISINKTSVQDTLKTLKELSTLLTATSEVIAVEKALKVMETVLENTDGIGNLTDRSEKKEMEDLVKDLNETSLKIVEDLHSRVMEWPFAIHKLSGSPNQDEIISSFGYLNTILDRILALQKFTPTTAWTSTVFKNSLQSLTPILKVMTEAQKYQTSMTQLTLTPEQWTAYYTFMNETIHKVSTLNSTHSDIRAVHRLLTAHQDKNRNRMLEHTPGFPGGPSDVAMMFVDFNDGWMKEIIKSDRLVSALERLRDLDVLTKKVMDVLRGSDGRMAEDVTPLFTVIDSFNKLADGSSGILQGITTTQNCSLPAPPSFTVVTEIQALLKNIDAQFTSINTYLVELKAAVNADNLKTMCDAVLGFCKLSADGKHQDAVKGFKDYENIEDLKTKVAAVFAVTEKIDKATKQIKTDATSINGKLAALDTFYNGTKPIVTYIDCLKINKNLKSLLEMVRKIDDLRKIDKSLVDQMDSGVEAMVKVLGTSADLKKLKISIDSMKSATSQEIVLLKDLKDAPNHSKMIGWAVQGISNMKNVLEKKSEVDQIPGILNSTVVTYNVTDPEDVASLNALNQMGGSIPQMLTSLDSFKSTLSIPTGSRLVDQSEIFGKAEKVHGVPIGNLTKVRSTLEKIKVLSPADAPKIDEMEVEIKKLDSMGVDFASYQKSFGSAKGSLEALDTFFAYFVEELNAVVETKEEEEETDRTMLYLIALILVLVLLSVVIYHVVWYKRWNYSFYLFYYRLYSHPDWDHPGDELCDLYCKSLGTSVTNHHAEEVKKDKDLTDVKAFRSYFEFAYRKDNVDTVLDEVEHMRPHECVRLPGHEPQIIKKTMPNMDDYEKGTQTLVNANVVTLPYRNHLYLSQAPHDKTAAEKFWWMIRKTRCRTILEYAQLDKQEYHKYLPTTEQRSNPLLIGKFSLWKEKALIGVQFKTKRPFYVKISCSNAFAPNGNRDVKEMVAYLKFVLKERYPVAITCYTGYVQSGCLAFAAKMICRVRKSREVNFITVLKALRAERNYCITEAFDYAYSAMVVLEYFYQTKTACDEGSKEKYALLMKGWKDWLETVVPPPPPPPPVPDVKPDNSKISAGGNPAVVPDPPVPDPVLPEPPAVDPDNQNPDPNRNPDQDNDDDQIVEDDPDPLGTTMDTTGKDETPAEGAKKTKKSAAPPPPPPPPAKKGKSKPVKQNKEPVEGDDKKEVKEPPKELSEFERTLEAARKEAEANNTPGPQAYDPAPVPPDIPEERRSEFLVQDAINKGVLPPSALKLVKLYNDKRIEESKGAKIVETDPETGNIKHSEASIRERERRIEELEAKRQQRKAAKAARAAEKSSGSKSKSHSKSKSTSKNVRRSRKSTPSDSKVKKSKKVAVKE